MKETMGKVGRLRELIAQGEHQQQDFKYKVEDAAKLARSVSAFANTDGGRLLIGVRDDGSIHGVRSEEETFMMHAAACKFCTPAPTLQFETLQVPTKPHGGGLRTVVICTVMPSEQRPVFALEEKKIAYVRVADENIVASPVHLAIWRQEGRLRGAAYGDTPAERALLSAVGNHPTGLPLNRLLREAVSFLREDHSPKLDTASRMRIDRSFAIECLARFIRFGLVQIVRHEQEWLFVAEKEC